jgi:hypothetical protein
MTAPRPSIVTSLTMSTRDDTEWRRLSLDQFSAISNALTSQLHSSILLGFLSLIPNNALRYTMLAITTCIAVLSAIHLKRPSAQLGQLADFIHRTDENIGEAKSLCPRDLLNLSQHGVRLLE